MTCQVLPPSFDGYRPYCPYTVDPSSDGAWTGSRPASARGSSSAPPARAGQAVTVWIPTSIQIGTAAGRYVVSVLDRLGYKARYRLAASPFSHGGQAPPPGGLLRLGTPDYAAAGRLHPADAHLRRLQP